MIQSPPRRPSNVAAVVILGFFVGFVAEFVIDLILDFALQLHSLSAIDTVSFVVSLVLGVIVGGVMFLGRPRHYGITALVGASVVVSGMIADEISTPVYFTIRHLPFSAELLTGYFTHARPIFWINNLCSFAVAAGLTALRVRRVRATEGTTAGAGMPAPSWGPPPALPGPWGPQPQQPYGGGAYPQSPPPNGPPPQPPHGPPPQPPYGPPPQPPYGPPPQPPYGPPPQPPYGPPPQAPYGPPPQAPYDQPPPAPYGPPS